MFMMIVVTQVMREEGLEQVTGLSCGTGDNQMVNRISSLFIKKVHLDDPMPVNFLSLSPS